MGITTVPAFVAYGLSRNLAFTGLVTCAIFVIAATQSHPPRATAWAALSAVIAIGMFGRFLKFYAGFAAEVVRSYAAEPALPKGA